MLRSPSLKAGAMTTWRAVGLELKSTLPVCLCQTLQSASTNLVLAATVCAQAFSFSPHPHLGDGPMEIFSAPLSTSELNEFYQRSRVLSPLEPMRDHSFSQQLRNVHPPSSFCRVMVEMSEVKSAPDAVIADRMRTERTGSCQ